MTILSRKKYLALVDKEKKNWKKTLAQLIVPFTTIGNTEAI